MILYWLERNLLVCYLDNSLLGLHTTKIKVAKQLKINSRN